MGECGFLEPILGGLAYPGRLSRSSRSRPRAVVARRRPAARRARGRDPGGRGTAARSSAPRQRRIRADQGGRGGADRPARDRGAAFGQRLARAAVQRRAQRGARRARAGRGRVRRAPADAAFAAADRFLADAPEPRLPFSGADLIARGVARGRPSAKRCGRFRRYGFARASPRSRRRSRACSRRRWRTRRGGRRGRAGSLRPAK